MPQPLAPQDSFRRGGLQRSISALAPPSSLGNKAGGGLLAKTRSILRKRNSSAGIKTHVDGPVSLAQQTDPPNWYENQVPSLSNGGAAKLGKRLSKRK